LTGSGAATGHGSLLETGRGISSVGASTGSSTASAWGLEWVRRNCSSQIWFRWAWTYAVQNGSTRRNSAHALPVDKCGSRVSVICSALRIRRSVRLTETNGGTRRKAPSDTASVERRGSTFRSRPGLPQIEPRSRNSRLIR
jgi:hypothetical protein